MSTARDGDGQERDDMTGSAAEARTAGSRRLLLAGAGGGLALAASGLLLPEWLVEEAAAADHPVRRVQDRNDQQRKKHRRQGEHRREAQRRQDENQEMPRGVVPSSFKIYLISEHRDDGELWGYQDGTGTWYSITRTDRNGRGGAMWPIIEKLGFLVTALNITEDGDAILVQYFMLIEDSETASCYVGGKMTYEGYQGGTVLMAPRRLKPPGETVNIEHDFSSYSHRTFGLGRVVRGSEVIVSFEFS